MSAASADFDRDIIEGRARKKKATKKTVPKRKRAEWRGWTRHVQSLLTVVDSDMSLVVGVTSANERHVAIALEALTDQTIERVLDNHAHDPLGEFKTEKLAVAAAEKYARAWVKKRSSLAKCPCGLIDTLAKKKARRK